MLLLKMGFRNIFRQKRRSFFTGMSMVLGFALLSLSFAVSEGGYANVIRMFTESHVGHVQVHRAGYLDNPGLYRNFEYSDALVDVVRGVSGVRHIMPRVYSPALAFIGKKTTGVSVRGIDPRLEKAGTTLEEKIGTGSFFNDSDTGPGADVVIGHGMAQILNAEVGSELVLISQGADGSVANDVFRVVGIFKKNADSTERSNVYMHIDSARRFFTLPGKAHEIALIIDDYRDSRDVAQQVNTALMRGSFERLSADPWQQVEKVFYRSMQADKSGAYIFTVIIVLIVGIGVLNTVLMSILERTREFGIIKAMGTRPSFLFFLIVTEAFFLSVLSTVVASGLSVILIYPFKLYGIEYPEPVSVGGIEITKFFAEYVPEAFWLPVVVVIATSVTVSIFPALKAAGTRPVKAMRTF